MDSLSKVLKSKRKSLGIRAVDLAKVLRIDQALISKYENGKRLPTKEQIKPLAQTLEVPYDELLVLFYKEMVLKHLSYDELGLKALSLVREELEEVINPASKSATRSLRSLLPKIEKMQTRLLRMEEQKQERIRSQSMLAFVFSNCQLNGNSLSQDEIRQVHDEGMTIAGKSIKEHFEVMNHFELLESWVQNKASPFLDLDEIINIHNQLFKGVQGIKAGQLKDSKDVLSTKLSPLFRDIKEAWDKKHPIELVVEFIIVFQTIAPFEDANEGMSRILANRILMLHKYLPLSFAMDHLIATNYLEAIEDFRDYQHLDKVEVSLARMLLLDYKKAFKI